MRFECGRTIHVTAMQQGPLEAPEDSKKLLTDRSAYIAYLESQLELTVQSFDERLESVASKAHLLEEKAGPSIFV